MRSARREGEQGGVAIIVEQVEGASEDSCGGITFALRRFFEDGERLPRFIDLLDDPLQDELAQRRDDRAT